MRTKKVRRTHSAAFKAKVAIELLKGEETLADLSKKFGIHSNQMLVWKRTFTQNAEAAFERTNSFKHLDKERDRLFRKIGELEMERDVLKKSLEKTN